MLPLPSTNSFISYTDSQWTQRITQSRGESIPYTRMQYVVYTVSLCFNYAISRLNNLFEAILDRIGIPYTSRFAWWNRIIEHNGAHLYLGALPLVQKVFGKVIRDDAESLKQLGISAVLTVTEPFENNAQGIFLSAVLPKAWEAKGIKHLQLSSPDFHAVPLENIQEGVEFIRWNLQAGRSVYVHCKAGKGRSALVELCYLMKYHQLNAEEALKMLKEKRRQVKLGAHQWTMAKKYEQLLKQEKRS